MMNMFQQGDDQKNQPAAGGAQTGPLAARMRPSNLNEFVGQKHLVGDGRILKKAIEGGRLPSIILWGPPGSGKTTLANVIASGTNSFFVPISAVSAGVADLRKVIEEAKNRRQVRGRRTILFIDEIHRFNKSQQDAILPFVEDGTLTLIGATTENPSFEVTSALLSRCQVLNLSPLIEAEMRIIILRALKDRLKGIGALNVELSSDASEHLVAMSKGDARIALNALEMAALNTPPDAQGKRKVNLATIEDAIQHPAMRYDKGGDQHYDLISALHKSLRGSDPDASLYWLARMLEGGEDPLYIVRRMIRFASEDVGMADPQALVVAMAAQQAVHFMGMPEGNLALAEAAVYLATAPKSNALYEGYSKVQEDIKKGAADSVPLQLRNAPTQLMKDQGYGKGYKYAHDYPEHFVEQQNLPDPLKDRVYYKPGEQGYEKDVLSRLKKWFPGKRGGGESGRT